MALAFIQMLSVSVDRRNGHLIRKQIVRLLELFSGLSADQIVGQLDVRSRRSGRASYVLDELDVLRRCGIVQRDTVGTFSLYLSQCESGREQVSRS